MKRQFIPIASADITVACADITGLMPLFMATMGILGRPEVEKV